MKSILISIKPQYVAKILNGEKTIEVRKSKPKCDLPIDVYIYCTKDKELLHKNCVDIYWVEDKDFQAKNKKFGIKTQPYLNGKVVAKFTLNKVERFDLIEEIKLSKDNSDYYNKYNEVIRKHNDIAKKSCLKITDLVSYCDTKALGIYQKEMVGYAWYISNLVIFDRPRELGEFTHYKRFDCYNADFDYTEIEYRQIRLTKAPQSWQFVEVVGDK